MSLRSSCTSLLAAVLATASLVAAPSALAHRDPLEAAPKAAAPGATDETLTGELRELVVDDRVAGVVLRYRSLVLPDGSAVALRGADASFASPGATVEVHGRRNGRTVFVASARSLSSGVAKRDAAAEETVEGELRLLHVDYFEQGRSEFAYEVNGADGRVTPLALATRPEALQRGMKVIVKGRRAGDSLEPSSVTITDLGSAGTTDVRASTGIVAKAARTNNTLVILIRFADSAAAPFTQAAVQSTFAGGAGTRSVTEYFREASYGQQLLSATVTPWLQSGSATPANCDWRTMGTLARNAASAAGYTLTSYQNLVYVFPRVAACGWAGLGYIGASGVWINGYNQVSVYGHELGHNFGLLHAASLDCGANPVGGACTASEYGDPFDIMGNQTAMHVNAAQKLDLGWIAGATVRSHAGGASTYVLDPIETAGGTTYAVKVAAAANRTYWLEYRQPIGFDSGVASYPSNGVQVRVASPFETLCAGCDASSNDTQLLDMTPATSSFTDAALVVGKSWTDAAHGITFSVLSSTAAGVTVQVTSPGAATAATTTTIASSANPSAAGAAVTFTASVTGNAPTGTVSFRSDGTAIAGCTAVTLAGTTNTRTATCTTSALTAGTRAIVAAYGGDVANAASTSATLSQSVGAATVSSNVALASAGATASASSAYSSSFTVSSIINNERTGRTYRWKDATANAWPDWAQVTFAGRKTIDRVVVYSVQDNYTSPVEPTSTMTFSLYGAVDFTVQGWNGASWVTLAAVTGNNLVKRAVTFPAYTTDRIRISISKGQQGYSRLTEVEAWGY